MKKFIIIAILTLSAFFSANAQTTDPEIVRAQLVGALERAQTEVKASRNFISVLQEQVESKEKRIRALNEKDALAQQAIAGLQSEIGNLRSAITEAKAALEIRRAEVEELKDQLEKTRKKLKRARTFAKYLTATAAILAGILIIKR